MPTAPQQAHTKLKRGDYVLATKWSDGYPRDHFAVGFFLGILRNERYIVVDSGGVPFRAGGFRRVAKISPECGAWIVSHSKEIEQGSRSLWSIKRFWEKLAKLSLAVSL
jgi:hypothetical protein